MKVGTAVLIGQMAFASLSVRYFLPRGSKARDDYARAQIALQSVVAGWPVVSVVNQIIRFLREGPPVWSSLVVAWTAVPYLLTPRLIQAEMVSLSSKLLSSVAIAFFDLITDILLPYGALLCLGVRRFLKSGRCTRDAAVFGETRQDTVTSNRQHGKAASGKRSGNGFLTCQSTAITTTVLSMRETFSRSASSLAPAASMQSAFASLEVSPRYMRALSSQIRLWSTTEMMLLVFTNLMVLVTNQIWDKDASLASFFTGIAGLIVLLVVEGAFETLHVLWMVRINNLPLLRSEDEPGVVKAEVWTCLLEFIIMSYEHIVFVKFFMLHAIDPDKYNADGSVADMCPYFSFPFSRAFI
ncbi:unnamed protein product [Vitrella brassicaformis CCMP3155]|uniref:Uncharacterized protein n=1 Tax=Vitrella brassicaformis (strain CCMP3155) TaxID=1169540 RepID=A0A0G4EHN4_VITBC|nr:unnamed protein product [Vitrella brassicaformis CCMP3155]|eukprot:CEL95493.1 unnamed protein product [Vitrella brassicaformis CCMP3155]